MALAAHMTEPSTGAENKPDLASVIFVLQMVRLLSRNVALRPHKILRFDREDFYFRLG
jgi:hypothetical protein